MISRFWKIGTRSLHFQTGRLSIIDLALTRVGQVLPQWKITFEFLSMLLGLVRGPVTTRTWSPTGLPRRLANTSRPNPTLMLDVL